MSVVWAVPVVAAAVAAGLVAAWARALEEAGVELARAVARLGELRRPMEELGQAWGQTDARVAAFRRRHALRPHSDPDGGA